MPIVIRHNGALANLTSGLVEGVKLGSDLKAQKDAVEDAKRRRAQEDQRLKLAEKGQALDEEVTRAELEFRKVQRGYQAEDRAREAGERDAAKAGNARALGTVLRDERANPTPGVMANAGRMAGGAAAGAGLAPGAAGIYTQEDEIAIEEAQSIARQMDPERGARHVQEETERVRKARTEALKPKLIAAWKATIANAQGGDDPDNPPSMAQQDPEVLARAETNIKGLADGTIDPELSMKHFQVQQQSIREKRADANLRKVRTSAIQNRIARFEELAQTNPELEDDLLDRIHEAQTYLDEMNDPALEPSDAREAYTKAMASLHGRGTSSKEAKDKRSLYSEARKLAQDDVRGLALPPQQAEQALDRLTQKHLNELQGEGGTRPAAKYDPTQRFTRPSADDEIQGGAGSQAAAGAQAQGSSLPGAGADSGMSGAGAQDSDELAAAPKTIDEWKATEPAARDEWLTKIALRDPQAAVGIAAQLGLKGKPAKLNRTGKPTGTTEDETDRLGVLERIATANSSGLLNNLLATYQRMWGALPPDAKLPDWYKPR